MSLTIGTKRSEADRKQTLDAILASAEKKSLHRSLGALQLTLLGVGAIIGTGIFVSTDLGGVGVDDYSMMGQVMTQATGVIITERRAAHA